MFMFNYDPNINYTEYRMRICSNNWEYCDGKCNSCPKRNITVSTSTDIIPGLYKNNLNIFENNITARDNFNNTSINCIDKELYCKIIGPWSYYRETNINNWVGDLI